MRLGYIGRLIEEYGEKGLSRRGESIYYVGTVLFVGGLILLAVGFGSIIFYQIHYESEKSVIFNTILIMGVGLIVIALGINFMLNQGRKSHYVFSTGGILSTAAVILFVLNFQTNWYYPTISYVLALYLSGFTLLLGNVFGNVTLWLIHNSSEIKERTMAAIKREYTDEEIDRDIEEAVRKSIEKAGDDLQLDFVDSDRLRVGVSSADTESEVKIRDTMSETQMLKQTFDPGDTDEWGNMGIEKASSQLYDLLKEEQSFQKPSAFASFKKFFSRNH